ncbi:siderophore ferric iron reductase [Chitinibacter bivalviorum]|uniref:Siderophore ferric iron reductase n=1 Tax=Chitinibacter bivalviorum TaxID=2739434 RepID=A0A7H9BFU6_9NEIS|nr:siderophore ferric iron reductase [Chitinibacter bivalviorum]QLG87580.1 siderophore ferric iron reductase [Chitinibacter bivalviorum]
MQLPTDGGPEFNSFKSNVKQLAVKADDQNISPNTLTVALDQVAAVLPTLRGRVAQTNAQPRLAEALYAHWQAAQPAAGRHYWSARSWGMLIWQPAYLAVLAVHQAQCALSLTGLQQSVSAGVTSGFTLPNQQLQCGGTDALIAYTANSLRIYHQQHYPQLNAVQPYAERLAACLTVDCVLSALLLANQIQRWPEQRLVQLAERWLTALQWTRHGALMQIELPAGRRVPALLRQGCCQHFRLQGEAPCSNCPRRPLDERIEIMRSEMVI